MEPINVFFQDENGEELQPSYLTLTIIPRVGETIHYWEDGFPNAAGVDSGVRIDFEVVAVQHDLRMMMTGRPRLVHSVILIVRPAPAETEERGDG